MGDCFKKTPVKPYFYLFEYYPIYIISSYRYLFYCTCNVLILWAHLTVGPVLNDLQKDVGTEHLTYHRALWYVLDHLMPGQLPLLSSR